MSDLGQCPNGCGELVINEKRTYCMECGAMPGFVVHTHGHKVGKTEILKGMNFRGDPYKVYPKKTKP